VQVGQGKFSFIPDAEVQTDRQTDGVVDPRKPLQNKQKAMMTPQSKRGSVYLIPSSYTP
jgi:hypothetical protein